MSTLPNKQKATRLQCITVFPIVKKIIFFAFSKAHQYNNYIFDTLTRSGKDHWRSDGLRLRQIERTGLYLLCFLKRPYSMDVIGTAISFKFPRSIASASAAEFEPRF